MSGYKYSAFGLTICSDIEFSHLAPSVGVPDVEVRLADVPSRLQNPGGEGVLYQRSPGILLLNVAGVGRYLVSNGSEIRVEPAPGADVNGIRLFLFGSAFGALLHQRGILPLHGSAIVTPRGAAILTGVSGSGKSTLACAFHQKGYFVLADDVCAIETASAPVVMPGNPYLMLWADALLKLGVDRLGLQPARPQIEKYVLPLTAGFAGGPAVLHAIYVLEPVNSTSAPPPPIPLKGLKKIEAVAQNIYRPGFLERMNFKQITEIARCTPVRVVNRPQASFHPAQIVELLEQDFSA